MTQPSDASAVPGLRQLLQRHVDTTGDSTRDMARKADDAIPHQRMAQLLQRGASRLPYDSKVIEGLSKLLNVPATTVVKAYLSDIGLPVEDNWSRLAQLLPAGVENLTREDIDSIVYVTRQLVAARQTATNNEATADVVDLHPPVPDLSAVAARRGDSEGKRVRRQQDEDAEQQ